MFETLARMLDRNYRAGTGPEGSEPVALREYLLGEHSQIENATEGLAEAVEETRGHLADEYPFAAYGSVSGSGGVFLPENDWWDLPFNTASPMRHVSHTGAGQLRIDNPGDYLIWLTFEGEHSTFPQNQTYQLRVRDEHGNQTIFTRNMYRQTYNHTTSIITVFTTQGGNIKADVGMTSFSGGAALTVGGMFGVMRAGPFV